MSVRQIQRSGHVNVGGSFNVPNINIPNVDPAFINPPVVDIDPVVIPPIETTCVDPYYVEPTYIEPVAPVDVWAGNGATAIAGDAVASTAMPVRLPRLATSASWRVTSTQTLTGKPY